MTMTLTAPELDAAASRSRLVVIGNGMAGARAVEEILARGGGDQFEVVVFGEEPYGNYNRILLSEVLAGSAATSEIYLNPVDWYAENDVTFHCGVRVVRVDRFARLVYGNDGSMGHYDKLVIATGSRSFSPPLEGMWQDLKTLTPGVFGFRGLDDTAEMMRHAPEHDVAVVIGGGLLGLEAARGLQNHGMQAHVVHAAPTLMNQQLDAQAGKILQRSVEKLGIKVHCNARTTAVLGETEVSGVQFADGTTIDCDMVVMTAGIRPNVELARRAGLTVERAIVVDDQMRSVDDDDVYVVGECAQHRGELYGVVAPLWEQAGVLADHITGATLKAAYHGWRIATKLKVAGVDVASMGIKEP